MPSRSRRKLVVVGDGACGKTSLLLAFSKGTFSETYVPTVFDNSVVDVTVDGEQHELSLWDTAGQEDYDRLRPLSYSDSHAVLICFSIINPDSLENVLEKWHSEVVQFCGKVPIILVGLKADLREDGRTISQLRQLNQRPLTYEQGLSVASRLGVKYLECSSKTKLGVRYVFDTATRLALAYGPKPPNC
ncbi:GTP-binding protein Rho1 [Boothiomyces sp. JEL0866]|nr:GTP-binding protein Rho1 [Boothiomyces sp. JEL0866]